MPVCYQVNLQTSPGGGEIFTRFFTEALASAGWDSILIIAKGARFWKDMRLPGRIVAIAEGGRLAETLPAERSLVLTQNVLGDRLAAAIAARHCLAGIVHMPFYGRDTAGLPHYARLFAVSGHVRSSLLALELASNTYPEPLYGIADLRPRAAAGGEPIVAQSLYDWDRRKFRDGLLAAIEPVASALSKRRAFSRKPGLALGIVSRLTPIKQWPLLFSVIAPLLARRPGIALEIFGSGGYASVRDLKRALQPMRDQTRFWGQQSEVAAIYPQLDYVLSGLPEKEALGLNLLESQVSGTPVLAVNAAPFTETVLDGVTGHLFEDPRKDAGRAFSELLDRIESGGATLDRSRAAQHLSRFSPEAFQDRVARAMADLSQLAMRQRT